MKIEVAVSDFVRMEQIAKRRGVSVEAVASSLLREGLQTNKTVAVLFGFEVCKPATKEETK